MRHVQGELVRQPRARDVLRRIRPRAGARTDYTATSSAAAAVTALASAATTFRDEYAATLAKMVEIDGNRRTLKLSDLTTRVDTLKKERERLDAQLATDTAASNFDLSLKQQRLAAEAAELQAQAALDAAQATAEQRLEIEKLKTEIDLVRRELELLKAKQELGGRWLGARLDAMPDRDGDERAHAEALLRRYGYGAAQGTEAASRERPPDRIAEYQRRHRLPVTGRLDVRTRAHLLQSPAVGWTRGAMGFASRERRPPLSATAWPRRYSLRSCPIPPLGVDPGQVERAIEDAFHCWEGETPVRFPRQAQRSDASLIVRWIALDGPHGFMAQTFAGGAVELDGGEIWSITVPPAPPATADVMTIALHEIGHVMNIGDIAEPTAVMHGFFGTGGAVVRRRFTVADRQVISYFASGPSSSCERSSRFPLSPPSSRPQKPSSRQPLAATMARTHRG